MLEIYKDFELITIDPTFTSLKWRRQFSYAGEFQLETFFTHEKMEMFAEGNVIYKRNVDEAVFIEKRSVLQDINGNLLLIVSGRGLPCILDRRVFTLSGNYSLKAFLTSVINNNFLLGAAPQRQISNMRLLNHDFADIDISSDFTFENVYTTITKMLETNNIGIKMLYNTINKSYDLQFYKANETDVVFSREFANIIEQDYADDVEKYKNVVYVQNQYTHNNDLYTGLNRREISISKPGTGETVTQNAINTLAENKATKTLSNVINPYGKQYEYLQDFNVGSIVLAKNIELGYAEHELVTEITEFYDETGLNLEVNLGDYKVR